MLRNTDNALSYLSGARFTQPTVSCVNALDGPRKEDNCNQMLPTPRPEHCTVPYLRALNFLPEAPALCVPPSTTLQLYRLVSHARCQRKGPYARARRRMKILTSRTGRRLKFKIQGLRMTCSWSRWGTSRSSAVTTRSWDCSPLSRASLRFCQALREPSGALVCLCCFWPLCLIPLNRYTMGYVGLIGMTWGWLVAFLMGQVR